MVNDDEDGDKTWNEKPFSELMLVGASEADSARLS